MVKSVLRRERDFSLHHLTSMGSCDYQLLRMGRWLDKNIKTIKDLRPSETPLK
jgi:hypothetical protein